MPDHVYRVVEVVGTSTESIDQAIRNGVKRVATTLRHVRWFEVISTRGHIEENDVHHFQVTMKVGFTVEE